MICVAGDIGGTNSRLILQHGENRLQRSYRNADFPDFYQVMARFIAEAQLSGDTIDHMVLGLPAPVGRQPVRLTNIDWQVDSVQLQAQFPVQDIVLVNDFQAAAVGAVHRSDAVSLNPRAIEPQSPRGPAVVTGAGTGLGLAWFGEVDQPGLPRATTFATTGAPTITNRIRKM